MNTSQELANLFARDKIRVVRQKLIGFNPVRVMLGEMELTFHKNMPYYSQLTATVKGDTHRPRYSIGENKLSLNDQIDCLIDLASDPEVLG